MLLIPTKLKKSIIPSAGIGLFTTRNIQKNEIVWIFDDRIDRIIPVDVAGQLPISAQMFLEHYVALQPRGYFVDGDDFRFLNHSDNPNLVYDAIGRVIAAKHINTNEELTMDYGSFAQTQLSGGLDGCLGFEKQKI